jgi:putative flippase GtrA/pimeloyl-ACP methyl ester carboxylesterase
VNAHAAAVVILASTARVPLLSGLMTLLTREPTVGTTSVGGLDAVVVEPRAKTVRTIVFLNGGTRLGCDHPAFRRVARGMGRAGCRVVAPELPGLKDGRLTPPTLTAVVTAVREVAPSGAITLFGISAGGSLALLAAADPALDGRVEKVVAIAPWADLDAIVELAKTGTYEGRARATTPIVQEFVSSSLAEIPDGDLADAVERLSPLRVADRIRVPVELAAAPDEGYFPIEEVRKLAAALPNARLTVTTLLDHVRLRPKVRLRELARFTWFTARCFGGTRKERRATQPLRFLTVGTGGYAVGLFVFAFLYELGTPYAGASVAAYLLANALMYLGNRYFTFRLGREGFWSAYARYVAVGLAVAAANVAVLAALVEELGLGARVGQALSLLLISPAAFVAFKRWTFKLRTS